MAYRVYKPVTVVLCALFTAAALAAVVAVMATPQPIHVRVTTVAMALAMLGGFARHFATRRAFARELRPIGRTGVSLYFADESARVRWTFAHTALAEKAIAGALGWWAGRFPGMEDALVAAFRAQIVELYSTTISVGSGEASGTSQGNLVKIAWLGTWDFERVLSLFRHEFGHVAMRVVGGAQPPGQDGEHAWMTENNYGA